MFKKAGEKAFNFFLSLFSKLPQWLTDCILAPIGLHSGGQKNPKDLAVLEKMSAWQLENRLALTEAFKSLMLGLPHHLRALNTYFSELPEVDQKIQKYMYFSEDEEEIKEAGSPYSEMLMKYGLKISDIVCGIYAVEALLSRGMDNKLINEEFLIINRSSKLFQHPVLQDAVNREIVRMMYFGSQGDGKYGKIIFDWIVEVLENKPLLFERFNAVYEDYKIRLVPSEIQEFPVSMEKLSERWKTLKNLEQLGT